jgi:ABC-type amino acid transport substrate-binding protein
MISSMPFMLLLAVCAAASGKDGQACDAQKGSCPDLAEHGTDDQIALQSRVNVHQNTLKFASLKEVLDLAQKRKKAGQKSRATHLKLAQDVNYPPYAFKDPETGVLEGYGHDIAVGMNAMCDDLDIEVVQVLWSDCWTPTGLGGKLDSGEVDACMTYTHTKGLRNEFADFSWGILDVNKAAGLMSKLENGKPKVTGHDDLAGKIVADVAGWAPTADGLDFVTNKCTGEHYSPNYNLMMAGSSDNNNDLALDWLLDGTVDAVFLYSDQAKNYKKSCTEGTAAGWNCDNWKSFGKKFAYVQTGQFGYVNNGTTLALAKKGSGVPELLNPCLQKFMESQAYYDVCVKYDFVDSCYANSFFPGADEIEIHEYNKPTDEHEGDCSNGYCPCT